MEQGDYDMVQAHTGVSRRSVLKATTVLGTLTGCSVLPRPLEAAPDGSDKRPTPVLNLRSYGARGDGRTNDTDAFVRAAADLNAAGRGTLLIPPGTYIVGRQTQAWALGKGYAFQPSPILRLAGCRGPVVIEGLGREKPVLKAAAGLRLGAFHPVSGESYDGGANFTDLDYRADAYWGMVELRQSARVTVRHLELDGNVQAIELGGSWGDTGWQCAAYGIFADRCNDVLIEDVHTHHHGLDGLSISYPGQEAEDEHRHSLVEVVSEHNARQGLSWVGASGLRAARCRFNYTGDTGRPGFFSAPGAGVDIEPEDTHLASGVFEECEMVGNRGPGIVSDRPADPDAASVRDVRFEDCLIWGRSSMSLLVRNQDFRFERCRIVGYMVANGSGLPPLSILFSRCEITDETTPSFAPGYLIDVAEGGGGVGVDRCTITTARQHIGNLSDAKVTRRRFVAKVRTEALDENWLVLLYRGHVQDCTFHDALPSSGGGPITVNYGLNTTWEGNVFTPQGGRLVPLKVA
jgi:hypothetical protein